MTLHIETYGNGKPLLLIHGWGMHGGVWQPVIDSLAKHFALTIVDLPGMGLSTQSQATDLISMAEQLAAALPAGQQRWNICGWSLGGQVAIQLALLHPTLVDRLVLVGTTPKFVNDGTWISGMDAEVFRQFARNIEQDYTSTLMKFLTLQCLRSADAKATIKQLRESFAARPVPSIATLQHALDILLSTDLRDAIKSLPQPTLLVHGDRDSLAPVEAAHWLARHMVAAQLLEIPGASHAPFLSHTQEFVTSLTAFLHAEMAETIAI